MDQYGVTKSSVRDRGKALNLAEAMSGGVTRTFDEEDVAH